MSEPSDYVARCLREAAAQVAKGNAQRLEDLAADEAGETAAGELKRWLAWVLERNEMPPGPVPRVFTFPDWMTRGG